MTEPGPQKSTTLKWYGSAALVKLKVVEVAIEDSSRLTGEYKDAAVV